MNFRGKDTNLRAASLPEKLFLSNNCKTSKPTADLKRDGKKSVESNAAEKQARFPNGNGNLSTGNPNSTNVTKQNGVMDTPTYPVTILKTSPTNTRKPMKISDLLTNYNSELMIEVPISDNNETCLSKSYSSFKKSYKNRIDSTGRKDRAMGANVSNEQTQFQNSYEKWKSTTYHRSFGNAFEQKPRRLSRDSIHQDSGEETTSSEKSNKELQNNNFIAKISFNESETESESSFCSDADTSIKKKESKIYDNHCPRSSFVAAITALSDTEDDSSTSGGKSPNLWRYAPSNSIKSHGLFINSEKIPVLCAQTVAAKKPFPDIGERHARHISQTKEKVLDMMRKKDEPWRSPSRLIIDQPKEDKTLPVKLQGQNDGIKKREVIKSLAKRNSDVYRFKPTTIAPSPGTEKRMKLKLYKPITFKPRTIDSNSPERAIPRKHKKSLSSKSVPSSGSSREITPHAERKEYQTPKSCDQTNTGSIREQQRSKKESPTSKSPVRSRKERPVRRKTTELDNRQQELTVSRNSVETLPPKTPKCRRVRAAVDVDTAEKVANATQCTIFFNE